MLAPGVILLALIGVWLTHIVEHVRVGTAAGVSAAAFSSVHVSMLPVGALLALGAALAGVGVWRAWWALGRRLEQTRIALAGAFRGRRTPWTVAAPPARPSEGAQLLALWLPVRLSRWFLLFGDEAGDVGDATAAALRPARLHPHPGPHVLGRSGIHGVQHRRVGTVEPDQRPAERAVKRLPLERPLHP